jgi:hypothetical protein
MRALEIEFIAFELLSADTTPVEAATDFLVPFVEDEKFMFLKTIIPSRQATKRYLGEEAADDETWCWRKGHPGIVWARWVAVRPESETGEATVARYARATLRKDRRLNIRISSKDLEAIQKRALEEGLPYQTLIAGVLHKYASGRLRGA